MTFWYGFGASFSIGSFSVWNPYAFSSLGENTQCRFDTIFVRYLVMLWIARADSIELLIYGYVVGPDSLLLMYIEVFDPRSQVVSHSPEEYLSPDFSRTSQQLSGNTLASFHVYKRQKPVSPQTQEDQASLKVQRRSYNFLKEIVRKWWLSDMGLVLLSP